MADEHLKRLREQPTPYAKFLGIHYTKASPDLIKAELEVRQELCTKPDILHGGAVMSIADNLGGAATVLNLPPDTWTTTIESKTNFLAAIPMGQKALAECRPVHRGRTTMVWETTITREDGKPAAIVTQTQLVLTKS
ncbi:MAG: PaaI family thioesterase [Rhodospirillaceae bacterium]|jgi:1,4-dihydroxy-2-naphthoyl-CoA hydrolase|nr:PaaI family thioesterase [Rhodospirillaceae bacterium]